MKPVAIFRASATEGPGYFASYLERHTIPWELVRLDAGERVPRDARRYAGLVFMGGPMSVNDELPWIAPALELVRDAVRKDVPVLGQWLGELQAFESFHWHGETFTIPPGATRVMENARCPNQGFALGRHLGMQCH